MAPQIVEIMLLNFPYKGVGALLSNDNGKFASFVVKKPSSHCGSLSTSLVELDLGAFDNISDVFINTKDLPLNVSNEQATLVMWSSNESRHAAIGLSGGSFVLVNPYIEGSLNHVSTGSIMPISSFEFSHQDQTAACNTQGGHLCLVDIMSAKTTTLSEGTSSNFNCVCAWNHRVGHILASNSPGGNAYIWDIKLKKSATNFGNNVNFSSVTWIPDQATQLLTTCQDRPIIQMWDLRNTSTPIKEASTPCLVKNLTFSPHDSSMFLTTGFNIDSNDQLILWNSNFELLNALPFEFEPSLAFTQSYVCFSRLNPALVLWNSSESMSLVNIFSNARVESIPSLSTAKPGISCGFASRICTISSTDSIVGYRVICDKMKVDMSIVEDDITACMKICESKATVDEIDRTSWLVTSALFTSSRKDLLSAIGLNMDKVLISAKEFLGESVAPELKSESDDPEEFFRELGQTCEKSKKNADKKSEISYECKEIPQEIAKSLEDCIAIGDLGIAADLCLLSGRPAEALLLAYAAGFDEWNRISQSFISQSKDPLVQKIGNLSAGSLLNLIENGDLRQWRLMLASICTYAGNDFSSYCHSLATRLLDSNNPEFTKAASICYQVAGDVNHTFDSWFQFNEPIDTKVLRMAMFQKASRNSPTGASLDKFVSLVSKLSEKLAQSGFISEALSLLSVVQPQQMVEMEVYRISQLHGGLTNPPFSVIPLFMSSQKQVPRVSDSYNRVKNSIPQSSTFTALNVPKVPNMPSAPAIPNTLNGNSSTLPPTPYVGSRLGVMSSKTTAPTAVAEVVYPGMPVPWPIPTPTQQMVSESNATMDANMRIAARAAAVTGPSGEPMSAANFSIVNSTIKGLLARALVNESSSKKAQEIQVRIDQLFESIKGCRLNLETNNNLVEMCKSIEANDFQSANKFLASISSTAWDSNNKGWIMVLKRLVPR